VGGCAAVLLSARSDLSPVLVREALTMTASNAATPNNDYGWGIIDLLAAINYVFVSGDANQDGNTDIVDVVFLVNYLFKDGAAPDPFYKGNVNCVDEIDVTDAVYLVNYVLKNGPDPCTL